MHINFKNIFQIVFRMKEKQVGRLEQNLRKVPESTCLLIILQTRNQSYRSSEIGPAMSQISTGEQLEQTPHGNDILSPIHPPLITTNLAPYSKMTTDLNPLNNKFFSGDLPKEERQRLTKKSKKHSSGQFQLSVSKTFYQDC